MKKIVCFISIFLILGTLLFAKEHFVVADALNMRATPDSNGKVVKGLKYGDIVNVTETGKADIVNGLGGHWVNVKSGSLTGWCFDIYLIERTLVNDILNNIGNIPKQVLKQIGKVSADSNGNNAIEYKNNKIDNGLDVIISKNLQEYDSSELNSKYDILSQEIFITNSLTRVIRAVDYKEGNAVQFRKVKDGAGVNYKLNDITGKLAARNLLSKYAASYGPDEDFFLFYALYRNIDEFAEERTTKPLVKKEDTENSKKVTKLNENEKVYYAFSYNKSVNYISKTQIEINYVESDKYYKKEIFKLLNNKWYLSELYYFGEEETEDYEG